MSAGSLGSASGEIQINVQQAMEHLDALAAKLKSMDGVGGGVAKGIQQGGSRLDAFGAKVDGISQKYGMLGRAGLAYGAIVAAGFGVAITSAGNFEQQMSFAGAALGGVGEQGAITQEQFQALSDEALRIGANTSASATEAGRAIELLGKAGVDATTILEGGAQAVVNIAEATGESIDQSASSFGSLSNLFKGTGITATEMADAIVIGMNNSDASLSEFQTGIARLAPVIAQTGLSFTDSAAAIAYFNSRGFSAAEVGTSLTAAFNNLVDPLDGTGEAMQALGIHAFDAKGDFVGFPAIMDQVAAATEGMTDQEKSLALQSVFSADAIDLMADSALTGGSDLAALEIETTKSGAAAEASAQRMDNMKGAIEQLRGALESAMIVIGSGFTPVIRKLAEFLAGLVNGFLNLPGPIQKAITAVVGISGAMAGLAGALVVFGPKAVLMAKQMASMVGAITRLVPALLGLSAPILLIVGALALLAIAYKTNLFGFRDAVNGVASSAVAKFKAIAEGVRAFAKLVEFSFDLFRGQGQNPVEAALNAMSRGLDYAARRVPALAGAFTKLSAASKALGKFAGAVGKEFTKAEKIFANFRRIGLNPVAAALKTTGAVIQNLAHRFGPLAPAVLAVGTAFEFAGRFVQRATSYYKAFADHVNPVAAILKAVGAALNDLSGSFGPLSSAVASLGAAFMSLGKFVGDVVDAFQAMFQGNWTEAWDEAKSAVGNLVDVFKNFGSAAKSALSAVWDQLSAIDWNGVFGAVKGAIDGVVSAIRNVDWGSLIQGGWDVLYSGLQLAWDAVKDIPWLEIIGKLADFGSWLAGKVRDIPWMAIIGKLGNFGSWLAGKVRDIPWTTIVGKLADFGTWLSGKVSDIPWMSILTKIGNFAGWLDKKVSDIPWADLVGKLADFGTWLGGKVTDIPWTTIVGKLADFGTWLGGKVTTIPWAGLIGKIEDFGTWLAGKVTAIPWAGLIGRIEDFGSWLAGKVTSIPWAGLIGKIEDFGSWLSGKVTSIDWAALVGTIPDFSEWLGKKVYVLPWGALIGAITNFSEWLSAKVPTVSWPDFVPDIEWSDFVPSFSWPSKDEILKALAGAAGGLWPLSFGGSSGPKGVEPSKARLAGGGNTKDFGAEFAALPAPDFSAVTSALTTLQAAVTAAFARIVATATTATAAMAAQVGSRFASMGAQAGATTGQMAAQVQARLSAMASQASSIVSQMASQVGARMQAMASQATSSANQMRGQVTSAMSGMASQGTAAINQFAAGVQAGFSRAVSAAHAGVSQIRGAVSGLNLYGQGYSIGASLGQGIAAGIAGQISNIAAQATNAVQSAVAAANAAAKINSPSKLTMETGASLAEGLEVGISRGTRDVMAAMADLIPNANSALAMQSLPVTGRSMVVTNVVNVYPLRSDEYQRLISDARIGSDFARELAFSGRR